MNDAKSVIKNLRALLLVKGVDENRRLTVEGLTRSLAKARLSELLIMQTDGQAKELRSIFVEYFSDYAKSHASPTPEDYEALELAQSRQLRLMPHVGR